MVYTMSKKKIVKKSGSSTGGKVISRVNESDSKNKKVPVTSVTPKATTAKASKKTMTGTRKVVGALAAATPIGRGVKVASSATKSARATAANRRGLRAANSPGRRTPNSASVAADNAKINKLVNERANALKAAGYKLPSRKEMYAYAAAQVQGGKSARAAMKGKKK
jgi:hypothetical protein